MLPDVARECADTGSRSLRRDDCRNAINDGTFPVARVVRQFRRRSTSSSWACTCFGCCPWKWRHRWRSWAETGVADARRDSSCSAPSLVPAGPWTPPRCWCCPWQSTPRSRIPNQRGPPSPPPRGPPAAPKTDPPCCPPLRWELQSREPPQSAQKKRVFHTN